MRYIDLNPLLHSTRPGPLTMHLVDHQDLHLHKVYISHEWQPIVYRKGLASPLQYIIALILLILSLVLSARQL